MLLKNWHLIHIKKQNKTKKRNEGGSRREEKKKNSSNLELVFDQEHFRITIGLLHFIKFCWAAGKSLDTASSQLELTENLR